MENKKIDSEKMKKIKAYVDELIDKEFTEKSEDLNHDNNNK